jgi:hypothetical protein
MPQTGDPGKHYDDPGLRAAAVECRRCAGKDAREEEEIHG